MKMVNEKDKPELLRQLLDGYREIEQLLADGKFPQARSLAKAFMSLAATCETYRCTWDSVIEPFTVHYKANPRSGMEKDYLKLFTAMANASQQ
jgi:hypothetical protein